MNQQEIDSLNNYLKSYRFALSVKLRNPFQINVTSDAKDIVSTTSIKKYIENK